MRSVQHIQLPRLCKLQQTTIKQSVECSALRFQSSPVGALQFSAARIETCNFQPASPSRTESNCPALEPAVFNCPALEPALEPAIVSLQLSTAYIEACGLQVPS